MCVCSQASHSRATLSCDSSYFFFHGFICIETIGSFRVDFLSVTLEHRVQCPRVGLGVKIKDILKNHFFSLIFLLCNKSYLKNRYYSGLTFSL